MVLEEALEFGVLVACVCRLVSVMMILLWLIITVASDVTF
jgi:hypothetical protein